MRKGLAGAFATSLLVASALILVALADRLPLDAFHYRFADNLLIAGPRFFFFIFFVKKVIFGIYFFCFDSTYTFVICH